MKNGMGKNGKAKSLIIPIYDKIGKKIFISLENKNIMWYNHQDLPPSSSGLGR